MEEKALKAAVVLLYLRPTAKYRSRSMSLAAPRLVELGGRQFLAGTVFRHLAWWDSGLSLQVPLDEVELIYTFDAESTYLQVMRSCRRWRRLRRLFR